MDMTELRHHWMTCEERERPEREAQAHTCMAEIHRLTTQMQNEGWREASYCPKDGTMFWGWEPTMATPYRCNYRGEWPDGKWDAYMDGDVWPARPVLFKPMQEAHND